MSQVALDLLSSSAADLASSAQLVRDTAYGNTVTYSPKVFLPLTRLCRDRCGYCTFATAPARVESPFMSLEEVRSVCEQGAAMGCREALFTLGQAPEDRYIRAHAWLMSHGYRSTVHYLHAACAVALQTGLLPHANAGALPEAEYRLLREVTASQGMMLEALTDDLPAHRGAPDKTPEQRLRALDAAGRASVPFTTGLLVGIGESRQDRIASLNAIAHSHSRYGHIQEVIIQNFLPKPATLMQSAAPCPAEEHLWTIAVARLLLPPDISIQAPPNLTENFGDLLSYGCNDWGGVSPLTIDHVNPERAWPAREILQEATERSGFVLRTRLPVYESFVSPAWLDANVLHQILGHGA